MSCGPRTFKRAATACSAVLPSVPAGVRM